MSISCIHKFNDSKWKYLVSSLLSKPTLNKQKTKIKDFTNYVTVQLTILIVSLQRLHFILLGDDFHKWYVLIVQFDIQ